MKHVSAYTQVYKSRINRMNAISQCGFHPERTGSVKNRNAERSSSGSLWRKSLPPAAGPFPWQRMSPAFSSPVPWHPKSLKAWTPTQRTLLWALYHFPTAKLLHPYKYPHSSSLRQIIIFSLKQCSCYYNLEIEYVALLFYKERYWASGITAAVDPETFATSS